VCIVCGGVGANSRHKIYPVHQSYPHQIAKSQKKNFHWERNTRIEWLFSLSDIGD
jgi:hypothetical protein